MHARALLTIICAAITHCLTIQRHNEPHIETHIHVLEELPPLFIVCNLTDIITITAPITLNNGALYYLYSPNNDVRKLNITALDHDNAINESTNTKYTNSEVIQTYSVKNVNLGQKIDSRTNDTFGGENQFVIGPVGEEDHGNWVLSVFHKKNGSWVEEFQVITIQIIEHVPTRPTPPVAEGASLELGFAYPLPDIETCELILPSVNRPYDRYFREYERTSLDTCTYIIPNVTTQDSGNWTLVAVGNIVYEGHSSVEVNGIRSGVALPLFASSCGEIRYLMLKYILPVGLILGIYCL